jgi:DNA-binding transcriptional regulator YiaG
MSHDTNDIQTRRRQRRTAEEIQSALAEYQGSSLTQRQFAESRGISVATLQNWLRKARSAPAEQSQSQWIEVVPSDKPRAAQYRIELPGSKALVLGNDWEPTVVRDLLQLLSSS